MIYSGEFSRPSTSIRPVFQNGTNSPTQPDNKKVSQSFFFIRPHSNVLLVLLLSNRPPPHPSKWSTSSASGLILCGVCPSNALKGVGDPAIKVLQELLRFQFHLLLSGLASAKQSLAIENGKKPAVSRIRVFFWQRCLVWCTKSQSVKLRYIPNWTCLLLFTCLPVK